MSGTATEYRRLSLTTPQLEEFLQAMQQAGRRRSTLQRYRSDLLKLQQYLGPGGWILPGTLLAGQTEMLRIGYANHTICARLSTANRYLVYHNMDDLCQDPPGYASAPQPTLTRQEYRWLLQTARSQGRFREELLIRLFAEMGLPVQAIEQVTVEAVAQGAIQVEGKWRAGRTEIPRQLRADLALYIQQRRLGSGLLFVTRTGQPLSRSNINLALQKLASDAGLPTDKGAPRCLQRLCAAEPPPQAPRAAAARRADTRPATLRGRPPCAKQPPPHD